MPHTLFCYTEQTMMRGYRLYQRLGAKIRTRRVRAGMTQQELGDACGLTRASISNIETQGQKPMLHTLCLMADALDTTPESLLKGAWS